MKDSDANLDNSWSDDTSSEHSNNNMKDDNKHDEDDNMSDWSGLSYDNKAYKLFHSCDCEYPCMSIDSIHIDNGITKYNNAPPYNCYIVGGSYISNENNKLYIMKFCNLHETKYDDDIDEDDVEQNPDAFVNHV